MCTRSVSGAVVAMRMAVPPSVSVSVPRCIIGSESREDWTDMESLMAGARSLTWLERRVPPMYVAPGPLLRRVAVAADRRVLAAFVADRWVPLAYVPLAP